MPFYVPPDSIITVPVYQVAMLTNAMLKVDGLVKISGMLKEDPDS